MKNLPSASNGLLTPTEKKSAKLLMEKMGMSQKELREVNNKYGVSAEKLLELMQLSKYQFVYTDKVPGQCQPCENAVRRLRIANY